MNANMITEFLTAAIRLSTPIILAGLGATIGERAGVLNIGLEGMMLMGACAGAVFSFLSGSAFVGVIMAILVGALVGYIFAIFTVRYRGNQAVIGVALNILALGFTTLMLTLVWNNRGASPWLPSINDIELPLISKIPILGDIIGKLSPLVYLVVVITVALQIILFKTKWGLRLRAVGEKPLAAQTVGLDVYKIRYIALIASGALCGLAGAYLSIDHLNVFTKNMVAGRGYLAYAANVFGQWNPLGVYSTGMIFGAMDALQMRLQGGGIAPQFAQMIPYVVTVIAVTFNLKKADGPASLSEPFIQRTSGRRPQKNKRIKVNKEAIP